MCGGSIDAKSITSGLIKSPKEVKNLTLKMNHHQYYEALYPKDQDCKWLITADKGYKVIINITHMDIEGDIVS